MYYLEIIPVEGAAVMTIMQWLRKADNRDILKIFGGALAAIVLAAWSVFLYVRPIPHPPEPQTPEVKNTGSIFHVCRGEAEMQCGPHDVWIQCGELAAWANNRCSKWDSVTIQDKGGGSCGYADIRVTCTSR